MAVQHSGELLYDREGHADVCRLCLTVSAPAGFTLTLRDVPDLSTGLH